MPMNYDNILLLSNHQSEYQTIKSKLDKEKIIRVYSYQSQLVEGTSLETAGFVYQGNCLTIWPNMNVQIVTDYDLTDLNLIYIDGKIIVTK